MAHDVQRTGFHRHLFEDGGTEKERRTKHTTQIVYGYIAIRYTFLCNVIIFVVLESPVCKFADT